MPLISSKDQLNTVKNMTHWERLAYWVKERESIRLKKEAGEPKPWTNDPILQTYRFCNVRRMDDKVSRWLMDNWYAPNSAHKNGVVACGIARFFNKPETLELITDILFEDKINWKAIKSRFRKQWDSGVPIFTGAYMVRGIKGEDKLESVMESVKKFAPIGKAWHSSPPGTLEEGWKQLIPIYGVGPFISAQIMFDLRWHWDHHDWSDRMVWAAVGPGSRRGMNRIWGETGKHIHDAIPIHDFLYRLSQVIDEINTRCSPSITSRMEAIDYQNCLCEYDKYTRILFGEGRMKQLYPGKE